MNKRLHFSGATIKRAITGTAMLTVVTAGILSVSCVRRDLDRLPDQGGVQLTMDWGNAVPNEPHPETLEIYFYNQNGEQITATSKNNIYFLPSGKYDVLAFNTNVSGVEYANLEHCSQAYCYALPQAKSLAAAASEERWIQQPSGWIYGAHVGEIEVYANDTVVRKVYPCPLVQRLMIRVNLTGEAQAVTSMQGALMGIASSACIASGEAVDGFNAATSFSLVPTTSGQYGSEVMTFGLCPDDALQSKNRVRFDLSFNNSGSTTIEREILGSEIGDPHNPEIQINVDINVVANSVGTFTAQITKWEIVESDWDVSNRPQ